MQTHHLCLPAGRRLQPGQERREGLVFLGAAAQHVTAPKISWGKNQLPIFSGGNKLSPSFFQSLNLVET